MWKRMALDWCFLTPWYITHRNNYFCNPWFKTTCLLKLLDCLVLFDCKYAENMQSLNSSVPVMSKIFMHERRSIVYPFNFDPSWCMFVIKFLQNELSHVQRISYQDFHGILNIINHKNFLSSDPDTGYDVLITVIRRLNQELAFDLMIPTNRIRILYFLVLGIVLS
jgi:hypothetical protein